MKSDKALQQLEKLAKQEFDQLKDNLIYCQNGQYHVFDHYILTKKDNESVEVVRPCRDNKIFGSLRVAFSWCIAHKYQQLALASRLVMLDQEQQRMYHDVVLRQALTKRMRDADQEELTHLKITVRKNHLSTVEQQLTKCVNSAKYLQIQGFNRDETARIRPTHPTR